MKKIDIIVPCYNEEECIELFYNAIKKVFEEIEDYDFCIFYVDDGSKDNTLSEIKRLVKLYSGEKVKYVSFSRNFGKEAAIYVGLLKSEGDYVVLMDADLQHPPELLVQMINAIENGYDAAAAQRVSRKGEPIIRSALSNAFYHIFNRITAIDLVPGGTDYRMMTRQVVRAVISLSERERFTKGIYSWVGFKTKWIQYKNVERIAGKTKWSSTGLLSYASSGFVAFANTPLRGVIMGGMCIVAISLIYALIVAYCAIINPTSRTGYASIIIIMLFLGGVIITILGMIGEYMARIYMEVKSRPIYIAKETNIIETDQIKK